MNKCFFIGKIISEIEYKFALNKNIYSFCKFKIKTRKDKQEITIIAYNKLADYCFKALKLTDEIILQGNLKPKHIVLEKIQKININ